jgi:hypothetical protein
MLACEPTGLWNVVPLCPEALLTAHLACGAAANPYAGPRTQTRAYDS